MKYLILAMLSLLFGCGTNCDDSDVKETVISFLTVNDGSTEYIEQKIDDIVFLGKDGNGTINCKGNYYREWIYVGNSVYYKADGKVHNLTEQIKYKIEKTTDGDSLITTYR